MRKTVSTVLVILVIALSFGLSVMFTAAQGNLPAGITAGTATPTPEADDDNPAPLAEPPTVYEGWELVWSDEFNAPAGTPIDRTYWTCRVGGHGWGNAQLEYDTDRVENVSHDGAGNLVITARKEGYRGGRYTSARCDTLDKAEFAYGKIEARLNLPQGQGIWPAFWMLGANFPVVGWPDSGEIDIMEHIGREPRTTYGTVHGPGYSGTSGIGAPRRFRENVADDYHVFGIEWEPEVIRWYVDGELFNTITPDDLRGNEWVFDHAFYLIINVAVGGYWPGNPNNSTVFPQEMQIDWIRVYQREAE